MWRDREDAGSDPKVNVVELTQLLRESRMDSALSRNRMISLEDRCGYRGVRSSGLSTPAP